MNYIFLVLGSGIICFGVYILQDDYKRWQEMKQKSPAQLYKSVVFGSLLVIIGGVIVVKGVMGQRLH